MENRIYGVITIGLAVLIYTLAYKNYRKEKYQLCLFLIMLSGLILRVFTSLDFYLHEWDERYHALVAKNLIGNPFKPHSVILHRFHGSLTIQHFLNMQMILNLLTSLQIIGCGPFEILRIIFS